MPPAVRQQLHEWRQGRQARETARLQRQEEHGALRVEVEEQAFEDVPVRDLLDHRRKELQGETRDDVADAGFGMADRIVGQRRAIDPAVHLGFQRQIGGHERRRSRLRVRRRVPDLLVRLVHRVAAVHEHGDGAAGVDLQECPTERLVTPGLDQVDRVALIGNAELREADAGLHRTERERVVVELELRLVEKRDVDLQARRNGVGLAMGFLPGPPGDEAGDGRE